MKTKPIQLLLLFTLFIVIYSCEKDDSVIKQQNYLKTVALSEAKDFLRQSQEQSKSNPEGSFITSLSDEITYEDLTNTDEQVAVIPVTTQYSKLNSRLVLLTINGKLESAVVSLNPFENSTVNSFSGELLITDTDGRFIKAFKIENNVYMAEYVNNNSKSKESNKLENYNTLKDTGGSCRCVFSVCDYCQLEEVVIVVESTTPRIPTPYVSITHMYNTGGAGDEATGNEWDLGGSGSGYTDYSPDPEPETPCPGDPLANMKILGTPNNGIPGGQYGNARGYDHDGTDFAAELGTPVYAARSGIVANAPYQANWRYGGNNAGNRVYINTDDNLGNNLQLGYWHLVDVKVSTGQLVTQGQLIGYTGVTGNVLNTGSAGPHLHVRARFNGQVANPEDFLSANFNEQGNNTNNCN